MSKMSTRSQLTKDLNESVKNLLGKQVKILFKNVVRMETKGDKTENRVLVFSPCRILLLTAKVPTRIDCHFHYLEIQALESKRGNQLSITFNEKNYSFLTGDDSTSSQEVDSMICALATAIRNIFPTVPLQYIIRKIEVIPTNRLQQLRDMEAVGTTIREVGPCGGFSTQYACYCDFFNMPYREEVAWDVDNIYISLNTRELSLKDFEHLEQKDLIPIIAALEYNTWFTKLRCNILRLSHDLTEKILHVLKKSLSIEELHLENLGLKSDFINKLNNVIKTNNIIPLSTLDLSNNIIEDKGVNYLGNVIQNLNKSPVSLNLTKCGLTFKGANILSQALINKNSSYTTLTYLNLSENNFKDDVAHLFNFLSHPNAISHLDLSQTDVSLDNLFGALVKGCTTNLQLLNVSKNQFLVSKKNKEAPLLTLKQFFSASLNLKSINMSFCKLPTEHLKNLLLGLACNEYTKNITLDISNNSLGKDGAHVLESCIHGVKCISSLDISENNMEVDLANVILAISKNKSLKHLYMGKNTLNIKTKHISTIMDAVVKIIQDEDCFLQSLHIPDSKLKSDIHNFLNALGDNKCLELIDISGNLIGDSGARLLSKALQINTKLKTIIYDKNCITLQGYSDIAYALESNNSVQYIPFPIHDLTPYMKNNADKVDTVMKKIQELLNRNVQPRKNDYKKSYSLQPGFLLSSKQHSIDRLVLQTQDVIKSLINDTITSNNDVNHATGVIQDAENCKQLLNILQEVAQQKDEVHPVKVKLLSCANEIHSTICEYIQTTTDKMLKSSKELCPYVLHENYNVNDIKKDVKNKKTIPIEFVTNCVKHQAGTDIMNKLGEMNLMIAAHISEQVTDEVYGALIRSYKVLMGDISSIRLDSPPRRSRLSSSDSSKHGASDISITDSTSHQSDHSPLATPHLSIKRKSLHGRKLRPKSVVDSIEGLSADDIPGLTANTRNSEEEDSVTELPQLQHLVKGRPRRAKTRAPTRPLIRPTTDIPDATSQDLNEGLETFFRPGSVTPTSEECHSFQQDGSPNRDFQSPLLSEKLTRSSPLLKGQNAQTPRSRSSDNLQSSGGNTENSSSSPLTRRMTGDSLLSRESSTGSITAENSIPFDNSSSGNSTLSKGNSPDEPNKEEEESDASKQLKTKAAPSVAPKPRPWSMVNSEGKTDNLLSDGSSPVNSTGNTPDSGDCLDSSESSSIDRRIAKEKAKKTGFRSYLTERSDFNFFGRKATMVDAKGITNSRSERDSNHNCQREENAHVTS